MEELRVGMPVYSADGQKLGRVAECGEQTFRIEKGFFFPKEYLARYQQVARVVGDEVYLAERATELLEASGAAQPVAREERADEVRMPLAEEEAIVEKRGRETGQVRVRKEIVTEQKQVTIPVTREEVHIETVPTAAGAASGASFEPREIVVPVREEEVTIRKRPVVKQEVRITKEAHEEEQTHGTTVRKEIAHVEKTGEEAEEHPEM